MGSSSRGKKLVYIGMSADILHPGHINIIKEGQKLGEVVIGLLTDEAIAGYKRLPYMSYSQRLEILKNIKGIVKVIPQTTLDYRPNLRKLKPDYVVHGTDWRSGVQKQTRRQVIETLKEWKGSLVEPEYTEGVSSTKLNQKLKSESTSPEKRLARLSHLINAKKTIRAMEAHNGLSALIVENLQVKNKDRIEEFDAIWVSSFTDSIAKGKPDTELVDRTSRFATINEILEVTAKPIIFDGDTGGHIEHFVHTVKTLERLGVSAVVIEDKNGLKRNSLHSNPSDHKQETIEAFTAKIKAGLQARTNEHFMIIARIESLIIGKNQKNALDRARACIRAGASGIMIHSRDKNGSDIKKFAYEYRKLKNRKPLMLVPTSYNKIYEDELSDWGADIVVYANHLLRAAYPAMKKSAETILKNHRAFEAEKFSTPVEDFLNMTSGL